MGKALLVMDMPKGCFYCDCHYEKDYDYRYKIEGEKCCGIKNINIDDFCDYVNPRKPDWCPLKEMPEKQDEDCWPDEYEAGFAWGWNSCIDYILGEE